MKIAVYLVVLVFPLIAMAQPPAGYYNSASGLSCAPLKTALKNIITTGHVNQGYSALWTQYQVSDIKLREVAPPAGVSNSTYVIWDIYSDNPTGVDPYNFTPGTVASGGQQDNGTGGTSEGQRYNREHSVPISWHAGSGNEGSFSGSDYHHIFPTDKKVNAERANLPYGEVATAAWTSLNGSKRGSSAIAGITGNVFEPIDEYKGDVARAFLYFVTRYQDDMPVWGNNADATQAFDPNTFPSVDIAYLKMMIQWHNEDPVSQKEIDRNNAAYTYQGNRNPFVDYPQYVNQVWNASCPGLGALPVDIVFFSGKLNGTNISLKWEVGNESNLSHYEIQRSVNGNDYASVGQVKAEGKTNYSYNDNVESLRGRRLYYRIKKIDNDGKFSYSAIFTVHVPLNTRFSVYPNPASDLVRLQLNNGGNENGTVVISDIAGRTVYTGTRKATNGLIEVPVEGLTRGNYIVKLVVNGESFSQHIVIAR